MLLAHVRIQILHPGHQRLVAIPNLAGMRTRLSTESRAPAPMQWRLSALYSAALRTVVKDETLSTDIAPSAGRAPPEITATAQVVERATPGTMVYRHHRQLPDCSIARAEMTVALRTWERSSRDLEPLQRLLDWVQQ